MGRKTIYVPERDESLWQEAEKLAGRDSLAKFVGEALQRFVAFKKRQESTSNRIELTIDEPFDGFTRPQVIAFNGRQLASADNNSRKIDVYLTAKNNLLFFFNEKFSNGERKSYEVFSSLQEARSWPGKSRLQRIEDSLLEKVATALDEPQIVLLDI